MSLMGMVDRLLKADIRFVVIGGVAARAHGSARITEDLDICYDPTDENVARLATELRKWNAYLRGADPGFPFEMDARMLRNAPVMTLVTDHGDIDVMDRVQGVGEYLEVLAGSIEARSNDMVFRVLDLPALLEAKRSTGRPRDRDQIPELEALLKMRKKRSGR